MDPPWIYARVLAGRSPAVIETLHAALIAIIKPCHPGPPSKPATDQPENVIPEKVGCSQRLQFFRQMGSTIGIAVFGSILANRLNTALDAAVPGLDVTAMRSLATEGGIAPVALPPFIQGIVQQTITGVFSLGLIVVVMAIICIALIPRIPLRERQG